MVIDALQTGMVVPGGGGTGGTGSTDSAGSSSPDRMGVPPVIGFDLIPENVERLREGSLAFVINQQPERQGYEAVYALYRNTVLKESVESHIRIPVDLVTRETLRFHQGTMDSTKG
jgi:ABC-type sugar transport system substrate-binding protein